LAIYFGLKFYGGDIGRRILYPITLLVTFLHEFGHGIGAVITGGWVEEIQINKDGSGWTRSVGGNRPVIIMGGYLGSAIFGNILFYVGAKLQRLVKPMLILLVIAAWMYIWLAIAVLLFLFNLRLLFRDSSHSDLVDH